MISTHEYAAALVVDADQHPLDVKSGTVNMDEGKAPHVVATLTLASPDEEVRELIDPREPRRVTIAAGSTYHPLTPAPAQARTFDLGLRERHIDHASGEVQIILESDEALLMDDVWLGDGPNTEALAYQSSLRAIINNVVLDRIGASLEPGSADSTFYVLSDATNLITNPSLEVNANDWTAGGNSAIARNTTQHYVGAACLAVANIAVGLMAVAAGSSTGGAGARPVTAGKRVFFAVYLKANTVLSSYIGLRFYDASNNPVGADVLSTPSNLSTSAWQRRTVDAVAPAGATKVLPIIWATTTTGGTLVYVDAALLAMADTLPDYFDGDTVDTPDYGYVWTGAPGNSTSTRTALIDRSPELLNWEPGRSAWDFIQPLFRAASLRLFCDEQRRWFLVDSSYIAPGQTQLASGLTITDARDQISRDNDEWYDAALVTYRWNDADNVPQVRYDWYARPDHTNVKVLEVAQAYPGPGAAEYMVNRAEGKGRQITASAVSQYTAQPSQPVTITLDDTPVQTGVIASVEWSLDDDEMTIRSRGLTDTPPTAYIFGAVGVSYLDVPIGTSYSEFDWSVV